MHKVTLCDIYWNIQLLYLKRLSYLLWPSFMIYTAFPGSFSYWHQSFFWLCSVTILQTTNLQGIFFHGLVDYNYHDFMDIIKGFTGGASGKEPICQCKQFKRRVWILSHEDPLEEGMAIHPSILAWWIPWTEELGELQSIGSHRVTHDWRDLARIHGHHWLLSTSSVTVPGNHSLFSSFMVTVLLQFVKSTSLFSIQKPNPV